MLSRSSFGESILPKRRCSLTCICNIRLLGTCRTGGYLSVFIGQEWVNPASSCRVVRCVDIPRHCVRVGNHLTASGFLFVLDYGYGYLCLFTAPGLASWSRLVHANPLYRVVYLLLSFWLTSYNIPIMNMNKFKSQLLGSSYQHQQRRA